MHGRDKVLQDMADDRPDSLPKDRVTAAAVGSTITIPSGWPVADREWRVEPACDKKDAGQWACVTHKEVFRNNLSASIHEDDNRRHVVVWLCWEHGPEGSAPVSAGASND